MKVMVNCGNEWAAREIGIPVIWGKKEELVCQMEREQGKKIKVKLDSLSFETISFEIFFCDNFFRNKSDFEKEIKLLGKN